MERHFNYLKELEIEGCRFRMVLDQSFFWPQPQGIRLHNHASYEVHIVEAGHYHYRIDGQELRLSAGEFCLIAPNTHHGKGAAVQGAREYALKFEWVDNGQDLELCRRLRSFRGCITGAYGPEVLEYAQAAAREFHGRGLGRDARIDAYLSLLLTQLLRCAFEDVSSGDESLPEDETLTTRVDVFFAFHYREDTCAQDLARSLNMSVRQVNRILNRYYGTTFHKKLVAMRISAAKELLLSTDETVQAVADQVGYRNIGYFIKAFKDSCGMTPGEYRAASRIDTP